MTLPAKPAVLIWVAGDAGLVKGGSGDYRLFFFLSSSARVFISLQTSRMNPAMVAIAASMERAFSIMAITPFVDEAPPASDSAG